MIDAEDRERLGEGWDVFGMSPCGLQNARRNLCSKEKDSVLSAPQILGVPLLLLANKQDSPHSLSVEEIRQDYEAWHQRKIESARRGYGGSADEHEVRRERIASLDVMGISALEGLDDSSCYMPYDLLTCRFMQDRR